MQTSGLKILVLVKYVPDTQFPRQLAGPAATLERGESILSELDEYAIEAAVRLREAAVSAGGDAADTAITVLTMGPDGAANALRKALQLGADEAYHLTDPALAGSDAAATSLALAAAVDHLGGADLVLCGMASTDGETSLVPAQLAERLRLAQVTFAASLEVVGGAGDGVVRATRNGTTEAETIEAPLPALVSVTDQANDPRYPNFKAIMAAKKKPVTTLSLADIGVDPGSVGHTGSWTNVIEATERPARAAGVVITDEGDAGLALVDFLAERKLL